MKTTDFLVMDGDGVESEADAHGNNVAFNCPSCGHPVLVVTLENQRGSDERHPATCKECREKYFLDVRLRTEKLYIHQVPSGDA